MIRQLRCNLTDRAEAFICRPELVRQACEREYGMAEVDARLAAVEAIEAMRLPVGPVEQMIAESVAEEPCGLVDAASLRPLSLPGSTRQPSELGARSSPGTTKRLRATREGK
jgi:hypothetical protein